MGVPVKENMARAVLESLEDNIKECANELSTSKSREAIAHVTELMTASARAYFNALVALGAFEK